MMKSGTMVLVFSSLLFVACQGGNQQGGGTQTSGSQNQNVQDRTVEDLKQEVLDTAGACSEGLKRQYEKQIELQSARNTEAEMKNSLRNMKNKIKC